MYSMPGFDCDPRNAGGTIGTGVELKKRKPAREKVSHQVELDLHRSASLSFFSRIIFLDE